MTQDDWFEIGFNTDIKNGIKFNVMEKRGQILKGGLFVLLQITTVFLKRDQNAQYPS